MTDLVEASLEKLKDFNLPLWIRQSIPDAIALAYLCALPPISYAILQGVPANRLAFGWFWLGPTLIGLLFGFSLVPAFANGVWLAIGIKDAFKRQARRNKIEVVRHIAFSVLGLAYVAIVTYALSEISWRFLSLFEDTTKYAYYALLATAVLILVLWFLFQFETMTADQRSTRNVYRVGINTLLCFILTITCWRYLAPIGGLVLAKAAIGGGFPIEFVTDEGETVRGALVLENGSGWFLRFPDRCNVLVFMPSDRIRQQGWLDPTYDYFCHTAAQYIDSGHAFFPNDPEIVDPEAPEETPRSPIYYNPGPFFGGTQE